MTGPRSLRRKDRKKTTVPASAKQLAYIAALVGDYNRIKGNVPGLELRDILSLLSLREAANLRQKEASWVIQHLRLRIEFYRQFPGFPVGPKVPWRMPFAKSVGTVVEPRESLDGPVFRVAVSELADSVVCPFRWKMRREQETDVYSFQAELGDILHHPPVLRALLGGLEFSPWEKRHWWRLVSRERGQPVRMVSRPSPDHWFGDGEAPPLVLYADSPKARVLFSRSLPVYGKPDLIVQRKTKIEVLEEKFRAAPLPKAPFPSDLLQVKAYVWLAWENAATLAPDLAEFEVEGILRYCRLKPSGLQRRDFTVSYTASLAKELQEGLGRMREPEKERMVLPGICAKCAFRGECQGGQPKLL